MNLQIYQLIFILFYVFIFVILYKTNNKYVKYLLVILLLITFFANPFKMTVTSIKKIEREINRFDNMPERVLIEKQSFDDFNKSEIDKLDKLNEEINNEIHD